MGVTYVGSTTSTTTPKYVTDRIKATYAYTISGLATSAIAFVAFSRTVGTILYIHI